MLAGSALCARLIGVAAPAQCLLAAGPRPLPTTGSCSSSGGGGACTRQARQRATAAHPCQVPSASWPLLIGICSGVQGCMVCLFAVSVTRRRARQRGQARRPTSGPCAGCHQLQGAAVAPVLPPPLTHTNAPPPPPRRHRHHCPRPQPQLTVRLAPMRLLFTWAGISSGPSSSWRYMRPSGAMRSSESCRRSGGNRGIGGGGEWAAGKQGPARAPPATQALRKHLRGRAWGR